MSNDKTITLPSEDWLVIDQALQQLPYGRVVEIYRRMNEQFVAQADTNDQSQMTPTRDA
jgi:hypothetical protein